LSFKKSNHEHYFTIKSLFSIKWINKCNNICLFTATSQATTASDIPTTASTIEDTSTAQSQTESSTNTSINTVLVTTQRAETTVTENLTTSNQNIMSTTEVSSIISTDNKASLGTNDSSICNASCEYKCINRMDEETGCLFDDVDCIVTALREQLFIPVKSLSSFKNKKTSAYDGRTSSKVVGYSGVIFLIFVGLLIIIPDGMKLLRNVFILLQKKKTVPHPRC